MLSIGSVKSAGGAAKYYGADDYYVSGEADKPGLEWSGKGCKLAGLEGRATAGDFREVLQGVHAAFGDEKATGEGEMAAASPGKDAKSDDNKRPGWDFTFSAPKTVSLAILAGGDKTLDQAHAKANAEAMGYLERHFSVTRVRENGAVVHRVTGNLVYGSVVHGTSRAADPERHTHNVVANKTYDHQTGKWRALETRQAYKHQLLLGMIYQGRLAKAGLHAGHDFKRGHAVGTVELAAWTKDEMRVFSQRREQIEKAIATERARTGAEPSPARIEHLVLRGRPAKESVRREVLVERWNATADKLGLDVARVVGEADRRLEGRDLTPNQIGVVLQDTVLQRLRARIFGGPEGLSVADPYAGQGQGGDSAARAAVSFAVRHLEQNAAVFDRHQVAFEALRAGPVGLTIDRVEQQIEAMAQEQHLHPADRQIMGGLTTDFAVRLERSIVQKMQDGQGQAAPILIKRAAKEAIADLSQAMKAQGGFSLTDGQASACFLALTAKDRYVAVQGLAGTGKTTLFKTLASVATASGHELHGVAATHNAAGVLQRESGIKSQTIESWLLGRERVLGSDAKAIDAARKVWGGKTLLVDEASLVSNATMSRLQRVVEGMGIRQVIFSGDRGQIGSVEAGAPFRLLQATGIKAAEMRDIMRQRDAGLLAAVELAADHQAHKAIAALMPTVHQVGRDAGPAQLAARALEVWKAAKAAGQDPVIVVNTNAMRNLAATAVRQELIRSGELGPALGEEQRLSSARLTNAQAVRARSYALNQIVHFNSGNRELGFKAGDQATIVGLDHKANQLTLQRTNGGLVRYDLARERTNRLRFAAYDAKPVEIRQNETMVWERTDVGRGFLVGQAFTVLGRDGDRWTILDANGHRQVVTSQELQFTGYGHAVTADRRQSATSVHEIGIQSHKEGQATTMARAYVQTSRPTDRFDLITTDAGLLAAKLAHQDGINPSALEHLREVASDGLKAVGITQPARKEPEVAGKGASPEGAEKVQNHHQDRELQMAKAPQMEMGGRSL